jgi:hypothetical protein
MKLFRTNNANLVFEILSFFNFKVPSSLITEKLKSLSCKYCIRDNSMCKMCACRSDLIGRVTTISAKVMSSASYFALQLPTVVLTFLLFTSCCKLFATILVNKVSHIVGIDMNKLLHCTVRLLCLLQRQNITFQ